MKICSTCFCFGQYLDIDPTHLVPECQKTLCKFKGQRNNTSLRKAIDWAIVLTKVHVAKTYRMRVATKQALSRSCVLSPAFVVPNLPVIWWNFLGFIIDLRLWSKNVQDGEVQMWLSLFALAGTVGHEFVEESSIKPYKTRFPLRINMIHIYNMHTVYISISYIQSMTFIELIIK